MSFDANAHREASLRGWEEAAPGWVRRAELLRRVAEPVSQWMVQAIDPQPGQRVLELAAGLGETAMLAAELVAPAGAVIVSDQAQAMLAGARERARERGLANVEFQALNAEWIDLPLASVDAVLCRWGYMLMADPETALAETRRVLVPGGRLALAVWDRMQANPWALLPALELRERGLAPHPARRDAEAAPEPGPFALGDPERLGDLLEGAGFTDVDVQALELEREHESFEEMWDATLDLSRAFHDAVLARAPQEVAEIRASLRSRFAPYEREGGSLAVPGRTLVASAVG